MLTLIRANDRGHAQHGWLDSHHTFSFASYYDPARMGFRALRVLNDDRVAPATGFGKHGHQDMEIVTVVLSGALEHKDSMGSGSVMRPGDVQRMSAGTGVLHSEKNPSTTEAVHLLQIWILPDKKGHTPGYEQKHFPVEERRGRFVPLVSSDGRMGSLSFHQDATIFGALLDDETVGAHPITHPIASGRAAFVHVAKGEVHVNGERLAAGDALQATDIDGLTFSRAKSAEVLLFDLA
jgi:redox-sensitive bicupin YhaK (pirin superfamily)